MSKLFSDPEYERMVNDEEAWLELAIEPYRFPLNDILLQIPSEISIDVDMILNIVKAERQIGHIHILHILKAFTSSKNIKVNDTDINYMLKLFELDFQDGIVLDLEKGTISTPIFLRKKQECFPDDEIASIVADMASRVFSYWRVYRDDADQVSRLNEILELLGLDEVRKRTRSARNKWEAIHNEIKEIILQDKWKLRSSKLTLDMCQWIIDYGNAGKIHGLMNFTRLKCMTHKGRPIYSLEEMK